MTAPATIPTTAPAPNPVSDWLAVVTADTSISLEADRSIVDPSVVWEESSVMFVDIVRAISDTTARVTTVEKSTCTTIEPARTVMSKSLSMQLLQTSFILVRVACIIHAMPASFKSANTTSYQNSMREVSPGFLLWTGEAVGALEVGDTDGDTDGDVVGDDVVGDVDGDAVVHAVSCVKPQQPPAAAILSIDPIVVFSSGSTASQLPPESR